MEGSKHCPITINDSSEEEVMHELVRGHRHPAAAATSFQPHDSRKLNQIPVKGKRASRKKRKRGKNTAHTPPIQNPVCQPPSSTVGMKWDENWSGTRGAFHILGGRPARVAANVPNSSPGPNPACTLVLEQLKKEDHDGDRVYSWCERFGDKPRYVCVDSRAAKALIEFPTPGQAHWFYTQVREKPGVCVCWYRDEGAGEARIDQIEQTGIEIHPAKKVCRGPPAVQHDLSPPGSSCSPSFTQQLFVPARNSIISATPSYPSPHRPYTSIRSQPNRRSSCEASTSQHDLCLSSPSSSAVFTASTRINISTQPYPPTSRPGPPSHISSHCPAPPLQGDYRPPFEVLASQRRLWLPSPSPSGMLAQRMVPTPSTSVSGTPCSSGHRLGPIPNCSYAQSTLQAPPRRPLRQCTYGPATSQPPDSHNRSLTSSTVASRSPSPVQKHLYQPQIRTNAVNLIPEAGEADMELGSPIDSKIIYFHGMLPGTSALALSNMSQICASPTTLTVSPALQAQLTKHAPKVRTGSAKGDLRQGDKLVPTMGSPVSMRVSGVLCEGESCSQVTEERKMEITIMHDTPLPTAPVTTNNFLGSASRRNSLEAKLLLAEMKEKCEASFRSFAVNAPMPPTAIPAPPSRTLTAELAECNLLLKQFNDAPTEDRAGIHARIKEKNRAMEREGGLFTLPHTLPQSNMHQLPQSSLAPNNVSIQPEPVQTQRFWGWLNSHSPPKFEIDLTDDESNEGDQVDYTLT